jgi:serine/threonine protein kinase
MSAASKHLDLDLLARFTAGLVDDASFEAAAEHLAGCPDCVQLAESVPADPLAQRLRIAYEADQAEDSTLCRALVATPLVLAPTDQARIQPPGATPNSGESGWLSPPTADHIPPRAQMLVPGYEILATLGVGGMGVVYKARDTRLKRLVALKMIWGNVTPDLLTRFQSEAEAVARLNHPHIVQIHEIGQCPPDAEGLRPHYLALEFAPGGSLDRSLRQQRPTPRQSAQLVAVVARAVHAAHQAGIVHRDLKPANVLLAAAVEGSSGNTAFGFPKVGDFGLARFTDVERAEGQRTGKGIVFGTPSYMAPEQANSDSRSVGPPADVYALGAILYECLTGRPPFQGNSAFETLTLAATQPPVPPSQVAADVPAELERICLRCLNKSPGDRYPSAAALADDLGRFLEGAEKASGERGASAPCSSSQQGADVPRSPVKAPASITVTLPSPQAAASTSSVVGTGSRRWLALALLLFGLCVTGGVAWRLWPVPRGKPGQEAHPGPTAEPLKGSIDVTLTEKGNRRRQLLSLDDSGALPVKVGDEVRVEAQLNRPAYCYIVWIDAKGKVIPIYPWRGGEWGNRPAKEQAVKQVSLPEKAGDVWGIEAGPAGLETLLLLTREEPLAADVDMEKLLAGLGPQPMEDERDVAWFENGLLVHDDVRRAPNLKSKPSSNPLVRINGVLHARLRNHFRYTRAVTFANRGGPEK